MNLFTELEAKPTQEEVAPGAVLMRALALAEDRELLLAVDRVIFSAPLRQMMTVGGQRMSIMGTDCGAKPGGARSFAEMYVGGDPRQPRRWPPIPPILNAFAIRCATMAGFPGFRPDACHVNRYQAGNKLGLHQDRNECDWSEPIVSVSFGLECVFLFGGLERSDPARHILLEHGDVIVWGGPSRMRFHGVQPLKPGSHPLTGPYRINLTFRKVA